VDGRRLPGLPRAELPVTFILLVLPRRDRPHRREHRHVKAVAEMTGADLDPYMGRAIAADGVGTAVASSVGGSPTTTYAENIGVMARDEGLLDRRLLRRRDRRDHLRALAEVRCRRLGHAGRRPGRDHGGPLRMIGLLGRRSGRRTGSTSAIR
jgi:hypothetical protein